MQLYGISHVHSTHSRGGKLKIEEIVELAQRKGLGFVLLIEHAEKITSEEYKQIVQECSSASSQTFTIIPGLEFAYDDYVHLLGLSLLEHPGLNPLQDQILAIHSLGGLAVLAHANACQKVPYPQLKGLNGVEAWNTRYKARYAPRMRALEILSKIREQEGKNIPCFGGLDMHETKELGHLRLSLTIEQNTPEGILKALRPGNFHISNGLFGLGALETPSTLKKTAFATVNRIYDCGRNAIIRVKNGSKKG